MPLAAYDEWCDDAWDMIRQRSDVIFYLLTKRPQRVRECLPAGWDDGWENVFFNVCCENQANADERAPILLELPFKHKGLHLAPLLGPIRLGEHLDGGQIELVACGGENYGGRRPCDFDWVKSLREECVSRDITFVFMETGTTFIKDGKTYTIRSKQLQNLQAYESGMSYQGKPMHFNLVDSMGLPIPEAELDVRHFREKCEHCSVKPICNGCFECGGCGDPNASPVK
ncbi:MAG: DUF5131 family protein [Atopobiaceae bacterium]|nr:DUF5131 family protein [Atopobiaceae bacterium]